MMIKNRFPIKLKQICIAGTAFALLSVTTGCATLNTDPNEVDVSEYSSLTTVDAVKKLESNLKQSEANKLDVFAPGHYTTADKALVEARKLISKNEPREQIVQKVAVASAVLKNGDMVMRKVKDILEDQLVVKEKLDSLEADKVYRSEYGSLEERLNNIIREIENGHLSNNEQNRGKLLQDMQKLERRSIRYNAMHEPEEILKRVKYRSGEVLAPLTYQDAVAVFKRAEEFIDQNPNYESGIEQMGQEALFAAKRALYITEQVSSLSQKVNLSLEQVILDEEYRLYRVARELNSIDLRDNPLEVQSEQLAKLAKNKAEEYQNKEGLIIALRDTLIKVRDSSAELTALSSMSETLKKEKGEWLAKEALYKAKLSHLTNNLDQSQTQLDQTQQKLLSMKDENIQLSNTLNIEKENALKLQNQVNEANAKAAALTAIATKLSEPEPPETKTLETQEVINVEKAPQEIVSTNKVETEKPKAIEAVETVETDSPVQEQEANAEVVPEVIANSAEKQPLTLTINPQTANTEKETDQPAAKMAVTAIEKSENSAVAASLDNDESTPQQVAVTAMPVTEKPRAKITKKETMEALNSVMELLNKREPEKDTAKPANAKTSTGSEVEIFVDASE